jgi:surface antigen
MRFVTGGLLALGALVLMLGSPHAGQKKEPKYTIKEVMQKAHKGGLLKKVTSGEASKEDREELAELYVALSENEPPKGSKEDWKKKTSAMVKGAKAAVKDAEAGKKLAKIVNCGACHKAHK